MEGFVVGLASEIAKAALTSAAKKIDQEASLILKFEGSFCELQERLDDLHCRLRDADSGRQEFKLSIKRLLRELESVALEAQDVIDLCAVKGLVSTASSSHPSHRPSCFNISLSRCFGNLQSIRATYEIGVQIRNMNTILDKIEERVKSVATWSALGPSTTSSSSNLEPLLRRAEVIYREDTVVNVVPKRQRIEALIHEYKVVAVVGMGGSGKTHLLQHVFQSIKPRYEVAIWLCVSRTFTVKQLQLNVLAKLRELQLRADASEVGRFEPQGESQEILEGKIHDALKNRKYLIVFDDVWELQGTEQAYCQNVMEKLRMVGLPEHDLRTVLVSTRNHEVASQIGAHVYEIPLLSNKHSRDLLFKHLLPHSQVEQLQVDRNVEAEAAIDTALKRCDGLPLAIITVAGLLKHQNPDEWAKSVQYLSSSSSTDSQQNVVTTTLMLSFNHLDYRIKPCFVALGLFAEDEQINAENLIGMWLAEGHVRSHEEGILMLKHLCNRCLLEMKKLDAFSFRPISKTVITIHDLVHELVVRLCKEYGGICEISQYTADVLQQDLLLRKERISRIRWSKAEITCIPGTVAFPRSLHVLRLDHNENLSKVSLKSLAAAVALRTLDINDTYIARLPKCLSNFLLLKYLDIRDSRIKRFPKCLRNLKLLEYLYTSITADVPQWIGDLELLAFFQAASAEWTKINRIPKCLKCLYGVQIHVGSHDDNNKGDRRRQKEGPRRRQKQGRRRRRLWTWHSLSKLTQLEVLNGLYIYGFKEGCIPPPNIEQLTLHRYHHCDPALTLPNEWQCCLQRLQILEMVRIKFPDELHGFQNLSTLHLVGVRVHSKVISDLPRLQTLSLIHDITCESLPEEYGVPGAFPKLRALHICGFSKLKKMPKIEYGGMPCLSQLELEVCPELSEGCGWTQKVATLSALWVHGINELFKAALEAAYNSAKATEQSREDRGQ